MSAEVRFKRFRIRKRADGMYIVEGKQVGILKSWQYLGQNKDSNLAEDIMRNAVDKTALMKTIDQWEFDNAGQRIHEGF